MLEVDKISVFYGDFQALWEVSIFVKEREAVALIGANGAGKTTVMRTVSGLLKPKSGKVLLNGERIDPLPPYTIAKLGVIQVPEGRLLFPQMTVLENLMMGAYSSEKAWMKRKDTLEYVYSLFPILRERKEQLAGTLSGGEQQMLAIGRSLMALPRILLLDEPSIGLAPKIVELIFDVIRKIHEEGITLLISEQNIELALNICERGYVIETGRVVLEGSSAELMNNKYVKEAFLGL
ncbi:MAG: ABC transporter ATP-binding protein [Thermoproteota archaeon]